MGDAAIFELSDLTEPRKSVDSGHKVVLEDVNNDVDKPSSSPASSSGDEGPEQTRLDGATDSISEQKALPAKVINFEGLGVDEDVCSICLDEFDSADPNIYTVCKHSYHLQCIMQWAQRSRDCPLCYRTLQLQDEGLNELLPFGEYISPQQQANNAAALHSFELERFLLRLAAADQHMRATNRSRRNRHGREPSTEGTSMPQPSMIAQWTHGRVPSPPQATNNNNNNANRHNNNNSNASSSTPPTSSSSTGGFPSSWPPYHHREDGSGSSRDNNTNQLTPNLSRAASQLKARFAGLKLRESLTKTTKELKALFGANPGGGGGPSSNG